MRFFKIVFILGLFALTSVVLGLQEEGGDRCGGGIVRCPAPPELYPFSPSFKEIVSTSPLTFACAPLPGASKYKLRIGQKGGEAVKFVVPASACDEVVCSYIPDMNFQDGMKYKWHVKAKTEAVKLKGEKSKFTFSPTVR